jgi:hypothetical protein
MNKISLSLAAVVASFSSSGLTIRRCLALSTFLACLYPGRSHIFLNSPTSFLIWFGLVCFVFFFFFFFFLVCFCLLACGYLSGGLDAKLTALPDSIGKLLRLKELDLYSNRLQQLPQSIG